MKVALVHDWLISQGGAERVLEVILQLFPGPVFTLFQSHEKTLERILQNAQIHHSFLQKIPFIATHYRQLLPLFPLAIEKLDVRAFDLVISSSHAVAKGIKTHAQQLHICYCHTPMRYAWDLEEQYLDDFGPLKAALARLLLKHLRNWDLRVTDRVDGFIANSFYVAERIQRLYKRESTVIYPPVMTHRLGPQDVKSDFYLTVSRLVPYKKVDLIVEAFNQTPLRRIKIVGTGPELPKLQAKAGPNIEFLDYRSDQEVQALMAEARGFIFAAEEDFGIAPVEAQAAGTPVIAYGRGGALETVVPKETGLFFLEQTAKSLIHALEEFEKIEWNGKLIQSHSEKFGVSRFKDEFKEFIEQQWEQFCENRNSCGR